MGLCLPCLGGAADDVVETPDPELKRRQLAEAAEKRQMEASSRGIKNPTSVDQKKKKKEEIDNMMANSAPAGGGGGGGGLRWQVG
ncbi:small VCP/p97-interacting protein isoform X2 [Phyllobates terribilis]|uniref:small VCP/p97-interacting protein isoform X2 n=1 Tax=Phyllobates terribilis TaxID=111132 RepID=UPI003CCA839E